LPHMKHPTSNNQTSENTQKSTLKPEPSACDYWRLELEGSLEFVA
jgi:hypothetical protein